MPYLSKYSVKKSRLDHSALHALEADERGRLFCDDSDRMHYLFLPPFDGGKPDSEWGRLKFDISVPDDTEVTIFCFATDTLEFTRRHQPANMQEFLCDVKENPGVKLELFSIAGAKSIRGASDMLLYEIRGRYLFVCIRIEGNFEGPLSDIKIINPGDTFMMTLPEIYRKRNSFLHRYLSVLSSIFNDFQDKIDGYRVNLDPDVADKELLVTYAGWMGIDLSGDFLDESRLRMLVKEAPMLNRKKGTKVALERLCEIVLSEKCIVVENFGGSETGMFGESRFDVTILIKSFVEEKKKSQLYFLLNQFVPVRTHLRIIYLEGRSGLDTHSYLDINATVFDTRNGKLDKHMSLDGNVLMPGEPAEEGVILSDDGDGPVLS
ncbi:MAG: hypothetical protein K5655_03900 [Lachnospiraceae bacterium]|nr:hypothetical protein [Lachnospiraceae bacterium]